MRVHIRLLGAFGMTVDERPVPPAAWRRRSAPSLVKLLALQPHHRLRREQVSDALWPDLLLEESAPRLHTAAHYARVATGAPDAVVLSAGVVALFPEADVSVDVDEFLRAAEQADAAGGSQAVERALARYPGPLLPEDLYEPWTEQLRDRLRLRHLELLRAAGRFEDLVAADPLDEEAQLSLAESHLEHGRRQRALESLDRMTELFRRELGVEPSPSMVALRRRAEALPVRPVVPEQRVPAVSGTPRRARLPAPRTRLIGRDADLAAVADLLQRHRVVTIAGPGGAGKSTLALAAARDLRVRASDETRSDPDVVLVELAPVRDGAGVARAVAEAAGIEGAGASEDTALAAHLGPRPVLLLLDNCEHLVEASAALVDAVLDAGEEARVLVTSREPLRVDGEAVHRIGSLGQDSAQLFVERAVAVAGPDAVKAEDPDVVDLCARLDGLPLAIELAAAQLGHLSLPELLARLDDRLTLLVGGRPRTGARHSALAATIEWSYRLLSDRSRALFDRLGVFPASFDLDAVQAVADESEPTAVIGLLRDLVAKSLVVHDPVRHRYRLLETIRLFAAQRLAETGRDDEVVELLRRHVASRSSETPRVRTWMSASTAARSRDDLDNVRMAFEMSLRRGELSDAVDIALSLSTRWRNAVSYADGRRWVTALLEHDLTPRDRFWTLVLSADVALGAGDPRTMRSSIEEAAALSAGLDDSGTSALVDVYAAMADLTRPGRAVDLLEDAARRAREVDEPGLERLARAFRMVALRMTGEREGLTAEAESLVSADSGAEYDRYICLWAASLMALVDRDGPRLRQLMDAQLTDLMANGLRENWLTMYWQALALVGGGEEYLPQLRRARRRAEEEGRSADADCVLALAYAAACRADWARAATLLGASHTALLRDTASFVHLTLVRDQLVRPRLTAAEFEECTRRGELLTTTGLLEEAGL